MKDLLKLSALSVQEIMDILEDAKKASQGLYDNTMPNKIIANMFFEPSTRTQYSFNTAELRLGCKVITFNAETSSMKKGETFYDTIKTFESFGVDAVVIRSRQNEYYNELVGKIGMPILNAGDGTLDHPTQSLLDLYTIYEEFGHFDGIKVAMVGDIAHSRVAHSNVDVMKRLGMEVYVSGPEEFKDDCCEYIDFDKAVEEMDVIMLLRIQRERLETAMVMSTEDYHAQYGMNMERVNRMKPNAIIMHPAPFNRGVELADDVAECEKARIFRQMANGVNIRIAVIRRGFGEF